MGLVGEENPPMPKWQECYTLPKSAPIGGEHVQDSLALHHNFMGLHTHIYIYMPKTVGSPSVEHENF